MPEDGLALRDVLNKWSNVLRYLSEMSARKPELVDESSISRSTVDRAIRDLIEVDCVTETEGRYTATKTQ
jgi:DNA-binding IclR family transcriptional regulator